MKTLLFTLLACSFILGCKKEQQDCPAGYTGDNCEQEKKPSKVNLQNVFLVRYPATNGGIGWDTFSTWADPYFIIRNIDTQTDIFVSPYAEEIAPNAGKLWYATNEINPDHTYIILFYDFDSGGNDALMGSVIWHPYEEGKDFPNSITEVSDGLEVQIIQTYEF